VILKNGEAVLREVIPEDFDGITEVKQRAGLGRDVMENWLWLWEKNPAYYESCPRPSMGWVVERKGAIIGYFGNIPQRFAWGDRILLAGTATALCVDPTFRGQGFGFDLVRAWRNQKNVDIALSTTTNAKAGQLMRTLGVDDLPQKGYDTAFSWIIDPTGFARAALKKKGFGAWLAAWGGGVGGVAIRVDGVLFKRKPRALRGSSQVEVLEGMRFGAEFDDLWNRKAREKKRLLGLRNACALQWHFGGPTVRNISRVLCCRRDGALIGYAVSMRFDASDVGLARAMIVDLLVERDDPNVVDLLVGRHTRTLGIRYPCPGGHRISDTIRDRFRSCRPYARGPQPPLFVRSRRRVIGERAPGW
jgi:GNAT superfamily N-acetyltransferase